MSMAAILGLEVPVHGLVYSKDNTLTYFVKRFDRTGHRKKLPLEDFAQLLDFTRDTKYQSSMEQVVKVIQKYCTFPRIEMAKLFKLTLFNFLTGNEDMHLKNFSLITRGNLVGLSPAYDLLNTSIALGSPKEELALPLNGKKNNIKKKDIIDYFGKTQLDLNQIMIQKILDEIKHAVPVWNDLLTKSFLSEKMKQAYLSLLNERLKKIFV